MAAVAGRQAVAAAMAVALHASATSLSSGKPAAVAIERCLAIAVAAAAEGARRRGPAGPAGAPTGGILGELAMRQVWGAAAVVAGRRELGRMRSFDPARPAREVQAAIGRAAERIMASGAGSDGETGPGSQRGGGSMAQARVGSLELLHDMDLGKGARRFMTPSHGTSSPLSSQSPSQLGLRLPTADARDAATIAQARDLMARAIAGLPSPSP